MHAPSARPYASRARHQRAKLIAKVFGEAA